MALNVTDLVSTGEPEKTAVTNVADSPRKISDKVIMHIDDNRLAAHKTTSDNQRVMFANSLDAMTNIVGAVTSVVNTFIQACVQIHESNEQTRRIKIQSAAYVDGKREETRQIKIQQRAETVRYLAGLQKELEDKRLELQKFESELADRRADREFTHEQWRRKVRTFENILNPLLKHAETIRAAYLASNFQDETLRAALQQADEKLYNYAMKLNEIYG